jgi:hypothetical protein
MTIEDDIRRLAQRHAGREVPKPEAKAPFLIKGMGKRKGEDALIYIIPSHTGSRPHEKGITMSEFTSAISELRNSGELTRAWFNQNLHRCANEGSCNFTSIGGIFELLGLVVYAERGRYVSKKEGE